MNRYKYYYNKETKVYDIYEVTSRYVTSSPTEKSANETIKLLKKHDDILEEVRRLNNIVEPEKIPANRNSILESPLAKATREILKREK